MARDDFSAGIKDALAKRVNLICSNPGCGKPTSGPHSEPGRSLNIGVAAHITAAASGGPRFDASLTSETRASADNGIWLCQSCGKLVDNDAASFTVELLRSWKEQAEAKALLGVCGATGVAPEAVVVRWNLEEAKPQMLAAETKSMQSGALISVMRQLTPRNILEVIPLGTPGEKVRQLLGVQDIIDGNRWKYRFEDTQVEIAFDAADSVKTLIVALVINSKFSGIGAPFGDFVLGELTLNELVEMGHQNLIYRSSLRTKELVVPIRTGPSGAWDECFFGALVIHSGVGWLAETDFDWSETGRQLTSSPDRTPLNWVGVGTDHGEAPYFDWYIKA